MLSKNICFIIGEAEEVGVQFSFVFKTYALLLVILYFSPPNAVWRFY